VAVAKLGRLLRDSADIPRYVETLHRRGYRFVFPVTPVVFGQSVGALIRCNRERTYKRGSCEIFGHTMRACRHSLQVHLSNSYEVQKRSDLAAAEGLTVKSIQLGSPLYPNHITRHPESYAGRPGERWRNFSFCAEFRTSQWWIVPPRGFPHRAVPGGNRLDLNLLWHAQVSGCFRSVLTARAQS